MSERVAATDEVRWLSDREQQAWRGLLAMQTQLMAQLSREMQSATGLSSADFGVLVPLSEHPDGRVRVLELARTLQWEKSRLSHQLTRMAHRGLIERSNCSEDRRGAWVALTAAGRTAVEAAAPNHVASVRRYLFDGLTESDVDALIDISHATLGRLAAACADLPAECTGGD